MMALVRKLADGRITITTFVGASTEAAVTDALSKLAAADANRPDPLPACVSWRMFPDEEVAKANATMRDYRGAWTDETPELVIDVDMAKARGIHRDRVRVARAPLLAAFDVEYQRADEAGDNEKKKAIARQKQELRDAPAHPDIERAMTVNDLKRVWPLAVALL
jgi:hypothetical protein